MVSYMDELSVTEAENLKKAIAALFRQTCLLQMKYDPVTLEARDNPHYEVCARHRKFIEDYLSVMGCELIHDPQERVFRLTGEGVEIEHLSVVTTKVILVVRVIYRDKILGEGLNATVTTLEEIRKYGRDTGLIPDKLTMEEWKRALYVMSKHQMIEVPGAIQNIEDQTPIYLYHTIHLYCSGADLQELLAEFAAESKAAGDSAREIELEEHEREGGAEDEAGEEDFYQTFDE